MEISERFCVWILLASGVSLNEFRGKPVAKWPSGQHSWLICVRLQWNVKKLITSDVFDDEYIKNSRRKTTATGFVNMLKGTA